MKIVDIEVIELRIPGWTSDTFDGSYDNCLVLVHIDEDISGISEVDGVPPVIRAIVDALGPGVSLDPATVEKYRVG